MFSLSLSIYICCPIGQKAKVEMEMYPVIVDFNRSTIRSIKAGKFDTVEDYFDCERSIKIKMTGKMNIVINLLGIEKKNDSIGVVVEMSRLGFRPATFKELLALAEAFPDLQRQYEIVALGSRFVDEYDDSGVQGSEARVLIYAPWIGKFGTERVLGKCLINREWTPKYRFAMVREAR